MLDYMIKVLLFQALFLAVYDFILKRETFFQWNRIYLMATSILAYSIPLLKFDKVSNILPQEYSIALPEVMLNPTATIEETFSWASLFFSVLQWVFWVGVLIATFLFFIKLFKLIQLINQNEKEHNGLYKLVILEHSDAFSFFTYIFIGKRITQKQKEQIITHELVHVKQRHSLDLLFFEVQKILTWFNPFSYLYQQRIAELHEFIADAKAIKNSDKSNYFENLLSQTFGTHTMAFINPFFKTSLIKKRIIMLNKNKSRKQQKLKYLLLIPILASMLIYSSCEKREATVLNKNEKRLAMIYMGDGENTEKRETKSNKEGFFDMYMLGANAPGKEITYNDLTEEEKLEFDEKHNGFNKVFGEGSHSLKIYENEDGTRSLQEDLDWSQIKKNKNTKDYSKADEVPFSVIEKAPTWPGCETEEDPKKCTQLKIQEHILANFNMNLGNKLGLEAGKKKVYVQFTIDKQGNITDVKARAPHEELENEATRVVKNLPKMQPGEHKGGKKVAVKYTLPISFIVE